jgi:ketosteroid isomerase-like protein
MSASLNRALLERFYEGFSRGDAAAMNACYAPDIAFSDPVFGTLRGDRVRAMWTMLCGGLVDFSLAYEIGDVDDTSGHVRWVANYTYSATKRRVKNVVAGTYAFASGLIARHDDRFDLWKWSSQALGPSGTFLGWTPFVRAKIAKTAGARLDAFEAPSAATA